MLRISNRLASLPLAAVAAVFLFGCSSDKTGPLSNATVSIQDQCDPTTFNATLGAGACSRAGTMTLAAFNAELAANKSVAAWQFAPTTLTIQVGQAITATNNGGEVHTFTQVAQFGGGIVASLNTASGNPVEAAECKALPTSANLAAGAIATTPAVTSTGTLNYQCCIHPWMRTTVNVTG